MIDFYGNRLEVGDTILLPVSKGSHYLTSAKIEQVDEEKSSVFITYQSTPKSRWIRPMEKATLKFRPLPMTELSTKTEVCIDCRGHEIRPGSNVVYRTAETRDEAKKIAWGKVKSIEPGNLWIILESGERIRNVSICVLC